MGGKSINGHQVVPFPVLSQVLLSFDKTCSLNWVCRETSLALLLVMVILFLVSLLPDEMSEGSALIISFIFSSKSRWRNWDFCAVLLQVSMIWGAEKVDTTCVWWDRTVRTNLHVKKYFSLQRAQKTVWKPVSWPYPRIKVSLLPVAMEFYHFFSMMYSLFSLYQLFSFFYKSSRHVQLLQSRWLYCLSVSAYREWGQ